jgi:cytochrome c
LRLAAARGNTKMRAFVVTLLALTLSSISSFSTAGELDGADLYMKKTCFSCHGKDAKTPLLPIYPKLAGQNPDYAYNQMQDIKSGARNNGQAAAMQGVMHLVNDDEMRAIANWLASLQ